MKMFIGALSVLFFVFPLVSKADPLTGSMFGGYVTASVPCGCSGGVWIYYSELFLGLPTPITGALYFPPGGILYSFYQLGIPTTWELGQFVPGPGECLIPSGTGCVLLPALGTIEYMGTSLPGAQLSF